MFKKRLAHPGKPRGRSWGGRKTGARGGTTAEGGGNGEKREGIVGRTVEGKLSGRINDDEGVRRGGGGGPAITTGLDTATNTVANATNVASLAIKTSLHLEFAQTSFPDGRCD